MASNRYHFVTTWQIPGTREEIFSANHHWAMRRGEESLCLELARRHVAADPLLSGAIKAPPGPTFPHNVLVRFRKPG